MNTSAQCWYCSQCGLYLYSELEASSHHRSKHRPGSAQPRIYGQCADCGDWLTGIETVTHRCGEAEARVRAASAANRWWMIGFLAVLAVVCFVAAVVGRVMK